MASQIHGAVSQGKAQGQQVTTPDGREDASVHTREADESSSLGDHVHDKRAQEALPTKKQKLKQHFAKYKWWYLALTIIILAILLPLFFLVILPAIVQRIVDNQGLPVNGGSFLTLSPTQMMVSLSTSLNTPLPADIDATTLYLYNHGTASFSPFGSLILPASHVNHDTEILIVNQTVTVTNQTELEYWLNHVFDDPTVELSVRGDATVHLGALHSNAHIDKTVTVASLDKLRGFEIKSLSLVYPPEEDGTNLKGTVNLPNWGALTLGLGNLSFNLMSGQVRIGLITIFDVVLPPGNNTLNFSGQLFLHDLVQNFGKVLDAQAEALNNGQIQLDATGNTTIVNGERIPYIESVLNNKRLTSYLSVIKFVSDLINSVTGGGDSSIVEILEEVVGNKTLIEQALSHFNKTGIATSTKIKRKTPVLFNGRKAVDLLKIGLKMARRV
ncbi:hypothetical protein JX265_010402 [Neoarthrinium moseri]|uniref:Uncharacterized protein n=1 Tax=Neoarthrinium moseri TaxID=1658444 RepID=A0A9Q0AKP6_9PEZI|nr:uncharacterized protein JN550_012488 [Neoarthrinium moseri]KAI1842439.1 hypothetical protein JX266_011334 [Neoarthrinium moseri]KAI1858738.1 hypothetical protein JN550_012488 [Neoarthrinium moseri]KAI1859399.1 hypothetical protein JX265_010402 [Neoarthrinium moseri]